MTIKKLSMSLLPVLLLAGSLQAWGQATTGTISGRVADPNDKVVPGAKVEIRAVETGIVSTATTDPSGEFILTAMPPGHYTISVEFAGFATATIPSFELSIDQRARFNIPMKVGEVTSSVEVADTAPIA